MGETTKKGSSNAVKFILCSLLGFFMFFVSIPFNGKTTIPVDHVTTLIRNALGTTVQVCGFDGGGGRSHSSFCKKNLEEKRERHCVLHL